MRLFIAGIVAALFVGVGIAAAEPAIHGKWMRGDGNALVRIAPCGQKVCATNLWIRDTSKGEEVGDRLEMSLEPGSGDTFSGTAYDPKRKLNYSIKVTRRDESLVTRGCVFGGVLCRNVTWTAAK
jgi:uncharacterized protein (DUF2147 family)